MRLRLIRRICCPNTTESKRQPLPAKQIKNPKKIVFAKNSEYGYDIQEATLFAIQENFWTRNNKQCHGIEFYYIIKLKQELEPKNYQKIEIDKGEEKLLDFKWVT